MINLTPLLRNDLIAIFINFIIKEQVGYILIFNVKNISKIKWKKRQSMLK